MKIYCVTNYDELEIYFPTKKDALSAINNYWGKKTKENIAIIEYSINSSINKKLVCAMVGGANWSNSQKEIWRNGKFI